MVTLSILSIAALSIALYVTVQQRNNIAAELNLVRFKAYQQDETLAAMQQDVINDVSTIAYDIIRENYKESVETLSIEKALGQFMYQLKADNMVNNIFTINELLEIFDNAAERYYNGFVKHNF